MPFTHFRPKAGRFGQMVDTIVGRCQTTIGNSTTTSMSFGGHPAKCWINRATVSALTVPVSASGTILATLVKYDASATADVTLSGSIDLEALVAQIGTAVPLLSSLTVDQQTLDTGDTLKLVVVTTNTVGTAAVDLYCNVELAVQN